MLGLINRADDREGKAPLRLIEYGLRWWEGVRAV